jgi:hypothetical protein
MVDFGCGIRFHKSPALLRRKDALRLVDACEDLFSPWACHKPFRGAPHSWLRFSG